MTTYKSIHPQFKFNGQHFSINEMREIAYSFIKEGESYQYDCGEFILNWFDDNDFVLVQTSGTTGEPKKMPIKKKAMVNSAIATGAYFQLASGASALCCLPVKYIAGKMMLVRAFVLGLEIDFVPPVSNPLQNNLKSFDFVAMVPLQVEQLGFLELNQINTLIIGGAKINSQVSSKLSKSNCNAYETFSMTETVTHIALRKIGEKAFKVLPNVTISLDNRNCLVIDAPLLSDNQIITNDVVTLLSDTEFIWEGRIDNVINSGGIKLFPEQIEEKLADKITSAYFISSLYDDKLGDKLILVIEGKKYPIAESVFEVLDKYEKPKEIYFVTHFLRTPTNKIKRKLIIETLKQ